MSATNQSAHWAAYTSIPSVIIGIPSNLIVIAVIIYFKHLHNSFFAFIASLSVSNLIMVGFMVPLTAHGMLLGTIDNGLCQVIAHVNWFGSGTAFLAILMCVLDRYFATVWHKYYSKNRLGKCMTIIMITVCFILPIFLLLPSTVQNNGAYHPELSRCVISITEETSSVRNAFIAVIFAIPALAILYCFIHVLYHVKHKQKRILAGKERSPDELMSLRNYFNEETRLAKFAAIVVCYFVVTYLPDAVASAYDRNGLATLVHILWLLSAYGFACYPFLYCSNKEFLEVYKQIFCVRQLKQLRQPATDPTSSNAIVKEEQGVDVGKPQEHVGTVSGNVEIDDVKPTVKAETTL